MVWPVCWGQHTLPKSTICTCSCQIRTAKCLQRAIITARSEDGIARPMLRVRSYDKGAPKALSSTAGEVRQIPLGPRQASKADIFDTAWRTRTKLE